MTLELAVHALPGDDGPIGVQGIARDITARKELEEQLWKANDRPIYLIRPDLRRSAKDTRLRRSNRC